MPNKRIGLILFVVSLILLIIGAILYEYIIEGSIISLKELLLYITVGIPLFMIMIILYRFLETGKTAGFYSLASATSLVISVTLWFWRFQRGSLEEQLQNLALIFSMIMIMLILPIQLIRMVMNFFRNS